MKRFISSLAVAIFMIAIAPLQAFAADTATTGAWTWNDVSTYVSNRTNRPIWAMAHANSGWFYTDGQNLWNGGQVYRFDGSTNVTVTNEVRNAGLDRVDDIVSDGADTVLFLQDVVRMDNQFRIAVNKNGTYYNATDVVRGMLSSDEGISSISGNKGTWYLITTKGRVFIWYGNLSAPLRISLPYSIQSNIDSVNSQAPNHLQWMYSVNELQQENSDQPMRIAIMDDGSWLLKTPYSYKSSDAFSDGSPKLGPRFATKWYKVVNNSYSELTQLSFANLVTFTGKQVLFDLEGGYQNHAHDYISYDGSQFRFAHSSPNSDQMTAAWSGSAWVITRNSGWTGTAGKYVKMMYIFDPSQGNTDINQRSYQYTDSGIQTRDFFLTSASDNNGHVLFGGLASTLDSTNPSYPLTAKLVMITQNGATSYTNTDTNNNSTTDSSTGINTWEWIDPNTTSLTNTAQTVYHVGSWDADGIKKVEIYVNGTLKRTCDLNNSKESTDCSMTIYGSDYSAGTNIFANAKVFDAKDHTVWTTGKTIYRSGDTTSNNSNNSSSNNNVWTWLEPNKTTIYSDESVTYYVGAWDKDGIAQVTLMANGNTIRSCDFYSSTSNTECSDTIYAEDYSNNSTISLRARIVDKNGNETWSNLTEVYRRSGTSSNGNSNSNNYNGSIWTWFDGKDSSLNPDESTVFNAEAQDSDGINRIIISVNGSDKKTCNFGGSTSNVDCAYTVYANDYSANTNLVVRARYVDADGTTNWSVERDIYRNAGSGSNTNTGNSDNIHQWEWIEPNSTQLELQKTAAYHADAWSASAIKTIVLYVNGSAVKTCTFTKSVVNRDCTTSIVGRNYAQGSSVYMNALVTDFDGVQTWTPGITVSIVGDSTSSTNNNPNGWVTATTNREGGFSAGQSITISVNSDDSDGVAKTEIYVNGVRTTTCNNSKTCTATVTPPANSNYFNYSGTMIDKYGTIVTTGYKQIVKK